MPWFQQWIQVIKEDRAGQNLTWYQLCEFAPASQWVPGSADLWWEHRLTTYLLCKVLLSILQPTWLHIIQQVIFFSFFLFLSEPELPSVLKYVLSHQRNVKYLFSCKCGHYLEISGSRLMGWALKITFSVCWRIFSSFLWHCFTYYYSDFYTPLHFKYVYTFTFCSSYAL